MKKCFASVLILAVIILLFEVRFQHNVIAQVSPERVYCCVCNQNQCGCEAWNPSASCPVGNPQNSLSQCQAVCPPCGDGKIQPGEVCDPPDDGNCPRDFGKCQNCKECVPNDPTPTPTPTPAPEPKCGDGVINQSWEVCDPPELGNCVPSVGRCDNCECIPNPPPPATGACCYGPNECRVVSELECGQNSIYQGDGSTCNSNSCRTQVRDGNISGEVGSQIDTGQGTQLQPAPASDSAVVE